MSGHRSSITCEIGVIKGNKLLCSHFSKNQQCRSLGFSVQVIHKFSDSTTAELRKNIERKYMIKLRTLYPYGLNDRFINVDLMEKISSVNVHLSFFKKLEPINNLLGLKYFTDLNLPNPFINSKVNLFKSLKSGLDILNFLLNLCNCQHHFPCMESFGLITYICSSINRPVGLDFAKHVSHKLHTIVDVNINQRLLYICLDKLNFQFNRTLTVNNNIKCKTNLNP